MRQWTMPRWWHYLHIGAGAFLLAVVAGSFVAFDVHSPWSYVVLAGFVGAGLVYPFAGIGFGIDRGTQRLEGQRLAGVGTVLLGLAVIATWVRALVRGAVAPASVVGLVAGLLIVSFGVGALYRPDVFGAAARDDAAAN